LQHSDPDFAKRTWGHVMDEMGKCKAGNTKKRWDNAVKDTAFAQIKELVLIKTQAEHFLEVLRKGTVSTNVFLRRIHNFALDMNWIPRAIIPKRQWPSIEFKSKRAITWAEHQKLVEKERNPEFLAYYNLLWHLGGSQSDVANLCAEDINWQDCTLAYSRMKTGSNVIIHFGETVAAILKMLPPIGPLFPNIRNSREADRATYFKRRCELRGISGVTLHSYRYAWAERARTVGMPERFAQEALGHNSKAVHRAYAKQAKVKVPSLEEYEGKIVSLPIAVNQ
jgi:integrase